MSTNNKKAKWRTNACIVCGTTENLSKDHVLPRWFSHCIQYFGFRMRRSNMGLESPNITGLYKYQTLCEECNRKKSGIIDYSNPMIRAYLKQFCTSVLDIIEIFERGVDNIG